MSWLSIKSITCESHVLIPRKRRIQTHMFDVKLIPRQSFSQRRSRDRVTLAKLFGLQSELMFSLKDYKNISIKGQLFLADDVNEKEVNIWQWVSEFILVSIMLKLYVECDKIKRQELTLIDLPFISNPFFLKLFLSHFFWFTTIFDTCSLFWQFVEI